MKNKTPTNKPPKISTQKRMPPNKKATQSPKIAPKKTLSKIKDPRMQKILESKDSTIIAQDSKANKSQKTTEIKILKSGLNALPSFESAGVMANIKYKNRKDMALIFSKTPCIAAGVFTKNKVRAACVEYDKQKLSNPIQAIIINSGIANACTGKVGLEACVESAKFAAQALKINQDSILLASTGVIGAQLPMPRIKKGISLLAKAKNSSTQNAKDCAQAIMTTDTTLKNAAVEFRINNARVKIAGIAKGSGMIHPNMGTMLSFLITNANISKKLLQKALKQDVKNTYNMISVDGDTSTNDSVLLLSNKKARHQEITDSSDKNYKIFKKALRVLNTILAKKIASDGEGANKLISAIVKNAPKKSQARKLAKSVITSNLVKTAMFGNDANWGRILCAMGYSEAGFEQAKLDLYFQSQKGIIQILKNGDALAFSEKQASKILAQKEASILIDLKSGTKQAAAWGCDLSYEYVKINASYRS